MELNHKALLMWLEGSYSMELAIQDWEATYSSAIYIYTMSGWVDWETTVTTTC